MGRQVSKGTYIDHLASVQMRALSLLRAIEVLEGTFPEKRGEFGLVLPPCKTSTIMLSRVIAEHLAELRGEYPRKSQAYAPRVK